MAVGSAAAAAVAAEGTTVEDRAAAEAAARAEGLKTQARLQAELERIKRDEEDADRRRRQAGAQARGPKKTWIVALMAVAPRNVAEEFAKTIKAKLVTEEELRIMPDWDTGAHRFEYIKVADSEFVSEGMAAFASRTWCTLHNVKYRLEPIRQRAGAASGQPRATARASAPAWLGPQPKLYQWDTSTDRTDVSGNTWVSGTSYAKVASAGVMNPDQAAQFQAWLTLVDQKYGEKYDRLAQLLVKKAQSDEEEAMKDKRLEDAEKAILTIAAKLQEADATIQKQGKQIAELTKVASKAKTENMLLQTHLKTKNEQIDGLLLERDLWMTKSREEWEKETPPRQPGFDFSPAATMVPTSPTPESPGPVGQEAHETPTKQLLDMFGAGAMASPLQGTDGQPQAAAGVPESAAPAASAPPGNQARSKSPPWQRVPVKQARPGPAAATLSVAEVVALRARLLSPGGQWPIGYTGPRPEAPKEEQPQRRTKEENAAMRAARLEGTLLESLAVAMQGKRPPPTPSPASKATLAQEGPSKAAAFEEDSSESESGGDDRQ